MMSFYLRIFAALQLVVILMNMDIVNCQEYYIRPTLNDPCTGEPCLTLSQFSANTQSYISSGNTALIFQPGNHTINSNLNIFNVQKFTMSPLSMTSLSLSTAIICEQLGAFEFQNSQQILVTNLEFARCSGTTVSRVRELVVENSSFLGKEDNSSMFQVSDSRVYISRSNFTGSKIGGVLRLAYGAFAEVSKCRFTHNEGGVIILFEAGLLVKHSLFHNNSMENPEEVGVAIYVLSSEVIIHESNFSCNSASRSDAAAIHAVQYSTVSIHKCLFHKNVAHNMAGALSVFMRSTVNVQATIFSENVARSGGALVIYKATAFIKDSLFVNNIAETGGAIFAYTNSFIIASDTTICNNTASSAVVYILGSSAEFINNTVYSNNTGSLLVFNGKVNFSGNSTFMNNDYASPELKNLTSVDINEGGALTAFQSEITLDGTCTTTKNRAKFGGAVHVIQSKLYVLGELTVSNNTAKESGGGFYLSQSELVCEMYSRINFTGNNANGKGGGIHAIGSFISIDSSVHPWGYHTVHWEYLGSLLHFKENRAARGGAIYLEEQAKIYILKKEKYTDLIHPIYVLNFAFNSGDYGGAVYINDESNFGTCDSTSYEVHSTSTECFLQTLALHGRRNSKLNLLSTKFEHNYATVSGATLFGGLLDRCTASSFAEFFYKFSSDSQPVSIGGLAYLLNTSSIQDDLESISSFPVRLCFCRDERPDCSYRPSPRQVKKGENFTLTLVAVDQLNNTISNTSIHSYLSSYEGTLGQNQLLQSTGEGCTQLTFAAFSLNKSEELTMYAQGPCKNAEMSQLKQEIEFLPCSCPVGFEQDISDKSKCECKCNSKLHPYITECNDKNGTLLRKGDFWITYVNASNSFVIYPHCPRDYCQPSNSPVSLNLNIPNGSDAQCTFDRSGVLCGACRSGLSLSLDGTNCIACPTYWPALLLVIIIASILAGIVLVALVLLLNLTVAVGALNGVFFYANIVNINKSLLFPFLTLNYVTMFISWLNLDIGFDTCFFKGMDAYWKTWLQLVFPIYLVFLVIMIIVFGEYSSRFAHLIGKKDPVATLATLILLSYDKLFQAAIEAFSFAVLDYPDGSREVLWLPDANVKYFHGKHIPLFITALFVLAVCISYTALLFSWQWLLHCPDKKCLKWIRNQKLHLFLKSYHTPYTIKHRYWTGLLLLVRVALSISSAVNMSNDPGMNLLLLGIAMIFLIIFVGQCSPVYENSVIEFIEVTIYANITIFFAFSLYFLEAGKHQTIIAYISGTVAIIQFLLVIFYHVYATFLSKTGLCIKVKSIFSRGNIDDELINYPPLDGNARNQLRSPFSSLDHDRGTYLSFTHQSANEDHYTVNTYGSYSRTEIRVPVNEATENTPLIPT